MTLLKDAMKGKKEQGTQNPYKHEELQEVTQYPIKRVNFDIPEPMYYALKKRVIDERTTMSKVIRHYLNEYLGDDWQKG